MSLFLYLDAVKELAPPSQLQHQKDGGLAVLDELQSLKKTQPAYTRDQGKAGKRSWHLSKTGVVGEAH